MAMDAKFWVDVATITSPPLTLLLTAIGWKIVFKDSREKSKRAEIYDLLNKVVQITLSLNQRSAEYFLGNKHVAGEHEAWVTSVSVEISSLRAISGILVRMHALQVPDDFFFAIRKNYTLDAEKYSGYNLSQRRQKITDQSSKASKALGLIYELYPSAR